MTQASHPRRRKFWRRCRLAFRGFRIVAWLCVLAAMCGLIYINTIGLPGFMKRPLLEKLHASGVDLEFSRLRLRFYEGVVADNVRFVGARDPLGPQLTARQVKLGLNGNGLWHRQVQIDSLLLRQARLVVPLSTNEPSRVLEATNIQTELRLLPNDRWALDKFTAHFAGAHLTVAGTLTNASALRQWSGAGAGKGGSDLWNRRLNIFADALDRIQFSAPPDLNLRIDGDGSDLRSFEISLHVVAPGAKTPWGDVAKGRFSGRILPIRDGISRGECEVTATGAQSRWASLTNFHLRLDASTFSNRNDLVRATMKVSAKEIETTWARGRGAVIDARWVHSLTNPVPQEWQGSVVCSNVQTRWAKAGAARIDGSLVTTLGTGAPLDPALGWWTNVAPYELQWRAALTNMAALKLQAAHFLSAGSWRMPELAITNLQARIGEGSLAASAGVDIVSRAASAQVNSDCDPNSLMPALPEAAQRWLKQFTWQKRPQLQGAVAMVLPAWTNRQPDWKAELLPGLRINGEVNLEDGASYREVPVQHAHTHFAYSNQCWTLPDLAITAGRGRVTATHWANEKTRDFYWKVDATMDPLLARPALGEKERKVFELLTLRELPRVQGELWGRYHAPELTGFKGRVDLTNFTFRGESADRLGTGIEFTNSVLRCLSPVIDRGTQHLEGEGIMADFKARRVYITNAAGNPDPMFVARAIGPHIARAIEPYHFQTPPNARVNGVVPMEGEMGADIHFELDGGPFSWWKLNLTRISADVHWLDESVALRDVRSDFYEGKMDGFAFFEFPRGRPGTDFNFTMNITNALLQGLMTDLFPGTNQPEGWLTGHLVVTKANSEGTHTANGYGNFSVRDGLLWNIPAFGVLSPVLNGISPGLGNSRATAGQCTFVMTNGVVRSDNLDIRTQPMRLQYRGTVDLDGRLNARVEAELLRDMFLIGPLVSTVFWPVTKLFEFKVTGMLGDPKMEPLNPVSKLLLMPFRPVRTIKGLFPENSNSRTNAPPENR